MGTTVGYNIWKANHPMHYRYKLVREGARSRGIAFHLTLEQFLAIPIPDKCPILGLTLKFYMNTNVGGKHGRPYDDSYSLDRIDNDLPYQEGNVRWISLRANRIKGHWLPEELIAVANDMRKLT